MFLPAVIRTLFSTKYFTSRRYSFLETFLNFENISLLENGQTKIHSCNTNFVHLSCGDLSIEVGNGKQISTILMYLVGSVG